MRAEAFPEERFLRALLRAWDAATSGPGAAEQVAPERRWESAPAAPAAPGACVERVAGDRALDEALAALTVDVGGQARPLREVRLEGLTTLKEADLWKLVGERPEKLDGLRAAAIVRRLVSSGLFARVVPVVSVGGDGAVALVVRLAEQPRLTKVVFEGLSEAKPEALLEVLLRTPSDEEEEEEGDEDDGEDHRDGGGATHTEAGKTPERRSARKRRPQRSDLGPYDDAPRRSDAHRPAFGL